MQIPKSLSSPKDPFIFKDGAMLSPMMGQHSIPIDQQEPCMDQYNMGFASHKDKLNTLLRRAFKKEVILWTMDKNWNKDGDCTIVVFYSTILKPVKNTGSSEEVTVGRITPIPFSSDKKTDEKIDRLFDEFVTAMEDIKTSDL